MIRFHSLEHVLSYYAKETPDAIALLYEGIADNSDTLVGLTYRELYAQVKDLARQYQQSGKTSLGVLTDGSLSCIENLLAANLAGLQVVMLDAGAPLDRLGEQITGTDVDMLYGEETLKKELQSYLTSGVTEGTDRVIFFTSGTTNAAKAVMLTGKSLCQSAYNGGAMLPLNTDDRLLCILPLAHVFGFVCGLLWGLTSGATVALGRGPRHFMDDCRFFQPTVLSAVPTLLEFLVKHKLINPELHLVLVGAGDCPAEILDAAKESGLRVSFGYGLTETSSGVAISVGEDPYAMEICPDNTITLADDGEILIQAPTCSMQGYYKHPKDTDAVLIDGVLHTGDLGRFDEDGRLHVTGRKKEILVLSDGTKIFLPEYEALLKKKLDVTDSSVTDLAVTLKNEKPCLIYYGPADADSVWARLKPVMEEYPRSQQLTYLVVTKMPIPKTATGKIRRNDLKQLIDENR